MRDNKKFVEFLQKEERKQQKKFIKFARALLKIANKKYLGKGKKLKIKKPVKYEPNN